MTRQPRQQDGWWCRPFVAAVMLGAATGPAAVRAADDDVLVEQVDDGQMGRQPHLVDLGANFDANLFEQRGNGWVLRGGPPPGNAAGADRGPPSIAFARGRAVGERKLERIETACGLSAQQRRRLSLAIESDARRFAAAVDATRDQYAGRQVNMNEPAGQKQWHAFQQDVQRCREQLRQIFDQGSLFATVLTSTLDERQRTCLAQEQAERRSFHWRALVAETLATLDETLALSGKQHAAIEALLLAREPALRIDEATLSQADQNLRRQLVLLVLSEVDAQRLRATVGERQWRGLSTLTAQGRAMRSWIEQQGVLEPRQR
jgi:hypothetical protein